MSIFGCVEDIRTSRYINSGVKRCCLSLKARIGYRCVICGLLVPLGLFQSQWKREQGCPHPFQIHEVRTGRSCCLATWTAAAGHHGRSCNEVWVRARCLLNPSATTLQSALQVFAALVQSIQIGSQRWRKDRSPQIEFTAREQRRSAHLNLETRPQNVEEGGSVWCVFFLSLRAPT